jgi:hypothetical protein
VRDSGHWSSETEAGAHGTWMLSRVAGVLIVGMDGAGQLRGLRWTGRTARKIRNAAESGKVLDLEDDPPRRCPGFEGRDSIGRLYQRVGPAQHRADFALSDEVVDLLQGLGVFLRDERA